MNRSFWPDNEATGQLLSQLCHDLADEYEIDVLCGYPLHNVEFSDHDHPLGDHVTIHRIQHTRFNKASTLGRLTNLASFTLAAQKSTRKIPPPDLIISETDPFFLPLVAARFSRRLAVPFIAYLQDIYPDVAVQLGKVREGAITKGIRKRLISAYRHASRIVVLGEDMRQTLVNHGLDRERISIVPNWTDCENIWPQKQNNSFRAERGWTDHFVVMYSGNFGLAHELDGILEAARLTKENPHIQYAMIGSGVSKEKMLQRKAEWQLDNMTFFEKQPIEALATTLSAADVHLVTLKDGLHASLFPSKLYGILASGTATISVASSESELAKQMTSSGVGLNVDAAQGPKQIGTQMASAIQRLSHESETVREWGKNARKLAESEYDRPVAIAKMREVIRRELAMARSGMAVATTAN